MSTKPNPEPRYQLTAVRPDGLSYLACVEAASETPELIREFDRLNGYNLSRKGQPISLMVEDASGFTDAGLVELVEFMNFVWESVFLRVPAINETNK